MKITIKNTQISPSPALTEYIQKRFSSLAKIIKKVEEKFVPLLSVEIARSTKHHQKGNVYYVEVNLKLPKKNLRIEQYDSQVRAAVDKAKKRLKVALEKYKEELEEKRIAKEK